MHFLRRIISCTHIYLWLNVLITIDIIFKCRTVLWEMCVCIVPHVTSKFKCLIWRQTVDELIKMRLLSRQMRTQKGTVNNYYILRYYWPKLANISDVACMWYKYIVTAEVLIINIRIIFFVFYKHKKNINAHCSYILCNQFLWSLNCDAVYCVILWLNCAI